MTATPLYLALGTAGGAPTRMRGTAGALLAVGRRRWLIDPGEGALRALTMMGEPPGSVDHVHISHFHADCCAGLPAVLQAMGADHAARCRVSFPAEGVARLDALLGMADGVPGDVVRLPLDGAETALDPVDGIAVGVARLDHVVPSYGLRVAPPEGRPIAVLADTRPCAAAAALADGAGLCVARTAYLGRHAGQARTLGLLTAGEAAALARDAGADRLLMTGFASTYELPNGFLHEARPVFAACDYAQDLTRYDA